MNSSLVKAMVSVLFIVCVVCSESGFWQDVCIVLCIQGRAGVASPRDRRHGGVDARCSGGGATRRAPLPHAARRVSGEIRRRAC